MGERKRRAIAALGLLIVIASLTMAWVTMEEVIACAVSGGCVVEKAQRLDPYDWIWFSTAFVGGLLIGYGLWPRRRAGDAEPFPSEMSEEDRWQSFASARR